MSDILKTANNFESKVKCYPVKYALTSGITEETVTGISSSGKIVYIQSHKHNCFYINKDVFLTFEEALKKS